MAKLQISNLKFQTILLVLALFFISSCSSSKSESSEDKTAAQVVHVDSTPQNILLMGESMVEGLAKPFANYCAANGHQFNSVCWYSSTTRHWVQTDTLEYFLNKFNPSYVFVTIGGNEQFLSNLESRDQFISRSSAV